MIIHLISSYQYPSDSSVTLVSLCLFFRHGERSEGGDADPTNQQIHTGDQSPQAKEEPPCESLESSPPAIPEGKKEENEMEQDQVKPQLSSSVIIDMPNVHSSLELSTITGTAGTGGLWFSHAIKLEKHKPLICASGGTGIFTLDSFCFFVWE